MKTKSTVASVVVLATMALATACSKKEEKPVLGEQIDLKSAITAVSTPATTDTVTVSTVTYGQLSLATTTVESAVTTAEPDIYMSLVATTLDKYPQTNTYAAGKAIALYNEVTDNQIAAGEVDSGADLAVYFDNLGSTFEIETVPVYAAATVKACNMVLNATPAYATDAIVTYGVYTSYFNGGNKPATDFYYETIDPTTGAVIAFDKLVKADKVDAVRELIVETIANSKGQSVDEYLKSLNEYVMPDAGQEITAANFPVCHAAVTSDGLVVTYPAGIIAPESDGQPAYTLPTASLTDMMAY